VAGRLTTLLFDVMGTVVDIEGSIAREAAAALPAGSDADAFLARWDDGLEESMEAVRAGRSPWRSHEELRAEALAAAGELPPEAAERLATVVHRLDPWPESAEGLALLARSATVVALSNADLAELVDLSAHAGLAWHGVISAQFARSYKPDPAVYRTAAELLAADPSEILMVAAHPWDLRGAARVGFATAYIARPGAEPPADDDAFDLHAGDLRELAALLAER
jgi:2-haloacid dehalogenase